MKKSIFTMLSAALLTALSATHASASPSTCASQTVAIGLSCSLGDLTFTFEELTFTSGQGVVGDTLALSTPPTSATPGVVVLGFTVDAAYPVDIELAYKVTSTSADAYAIDSTFGPPQPKGSSIFETACSVDPTIVPPGCSGASVLATVNNLTGAYTVSPSFGPVSSFWIDKDITDGTVSIPGSGFSSFTDSVEETTVPEPMTMSLLGGGLALLGMLRFSGKKS